MAEFRVTFQSQPLKYYQKAGPDIVKAINECVEMLKANPFFLPGRIKRLQGYEGVYRYRIGGLRVVYKVEPAMRLVSVLAILPRGDIYKKI